MPHQVDVAEAIKRLVVRPGYFTYDPGPEALVHWHVNFAHSDLFAFYGGPLFAQDEWQVAEHPLLASVREALATNPEDLRTVELGRATPVLVHGVERRCEIKTDPDVSAGCPNGLYGGEFGRASLQAIERAVHRIEPPTRTNVIAMAAPAYGSGAYRLTELEQILATAHAGFRAAVLESEFQHGRAALVAIHTGFWGCGAFGGNRIVMTALQVLVAGMAGIDQLYFHVGGSSGTADVDQALEVLEAGRSSDATAEWLRHLESMGYEWGVSNGT
jgi:hypothetical protein